MSLRTVLSQFSQEDEVSLIVREVSLQAPVCEHQEPHSPMLNKEQELPLVSSDSGFDANTDQKFRITRTQYRFCTKSRDICTMRKKYI